MIRGLECRTVGDFSFARTSVARSVVGLPVSIEHLFFQGAVVFSVVLQSCPVGILLCTYPNIA